MASQLVVFSDLDGTLLDHDTYSFEPAREALETLRRQGIPLILATSKTAAEIGPLQDAMGLRHPAIVENGAGLVVPAGYFDGCVADGAGVPYAEIRRALKEMDSELSGHFMGFGDWSVEDIARRTKLTLDAAARARDRRWSEPGLWDGDDAALGRFRDALKPLQAVRGGRFLTLMGPGSKADRMAALCTCYRAQLDGDVLTVALGDAPNDREMIEAADIGVIVANPSHPPLPRLPGESAGTIRRTVLAGPAGWNRAILDIVEEQARPQ
ncbi:HAD-IIB family hydrolase [Breoghania sp. L-A4]|uniref:HAD-IIB family hydrolase n=1 Tax=Breoghania sp. L-A4 TaxID=2304600 RepID=UPI000E35924C|nr:HAD-IIB family hydrolase [Breoghania sp. L-A4]AXS38978.1 HAD-IIB family hydrolase [Breoghania sp. L-A4]